MVSLALYLQIYKKPFYGKLQGVTRNTSTPALGRRPHIAHRPSSAAVHHSIPVYYYRLIYRPDRVLFKWSRCRDQGRSISIMFVSENNVYIFVVPH